MNMVLRSALILTVSTALLLNSVVAQCPEFNTDGVPECPHKTDHELCVLGSHRDAGRLSDFEFIDVPTGLVEGDPLACKMRAEAIRQFVIYHGTHGPASTDCKRAAAIFKTNSLSNSRVSDVCSQIGFSKCHWCHHGGKTVELEDGNCKCECTHGWSGRDCQECGLSPVECMHEGNLTIGHNQCECACKYPWSGVHCEQCNRRCLHGGFSDPTDAKCQHCQCQFPWTGVECETCVLQCKHGGKLFNDGKQCRCDCPVLALGPQCEQCTARCLNGGVLDKETCTCKCPGGFTGHQCETCDVECKHNATFIPNDCSCSCTNPFTSGQDCGACNNTCSGRGREVGCHCVDCEGYWQGPTCNKCGLRCVNEGELESRSCKCSCDQERCHNGQFLDDCSCQCDGSWRGETCNQCHLNCRHGTLQSDNCTCSCFGNFSGIRCDRCEHDCTGRGLLNPNKCLCDRCTPPYYGYDCQQRCNKDCKHGAVIDYSTCTCNECVLPWTGPECNTCSILVNAVDKSQPCGPNGVYDAENCQCICKEGWAGATCDKCVRICAQGTLNNNTCSCTCDMHWQGVNCTDCGIQCQNGGVVDKKNCYCNCDHSHSGTYCQGGPCHSQIACDSCLSVSDGCEWCAGSGTCSKKPGPGAVSTCVGPSKTGICPTYGDCHMCDYTPTELQWLADNGQRTLAFDTHSLAMPDSGDVDTEVLECDASKQETWCPEKKACVQDWVGGDGGPCKPLDESHRSTSLNGFVGEGA